MKRILLLLLALVSQFYVNGQIITGATGRFRTSLELAGYKVTSISNDSALAGNSALALTTQYAVRNYVANYVASRGLPSQTGNSGKYLTTNGTVASWGALTPTTPAGASMQVQYNNAGSFGALDSFTVFANPDRIGIGVPVPTARLDIQGSGSTSATNALRVRNSAGTNLLAIRNDGYVGIGTTTPASTLDIRGGNTVDGLNVHLTGQNPYLAQFYNDAYSSSTSIFQYFGYNSGNFAMGSPAAKSIALYTTTGSSSYTSPEISLVGDGNMKMLIGGGKLSVGSATNASAGVHLFYNTTASTPSMLLSGTGYSGGTSTTTKPTFLIEPTGTTSTGWGTSGTKLGVNAESGFTGLLMDLELNGVTQFSVASGGSLNIKGGISAPSGGITSGSDIVSGGYFGVTSRSWFRSATNGNWTLYNNATTDFGLLQFGGTTSSFPALKRNGAGLDVRLADDSGYGLFSTGKTTIYGSGATSATTSLLVQNSSASEILSTQDNGTINIGKNVSATTQNTAHIAAKGSDTNLGIAIVPKGTGAITVVVPDGTTTGGNSRGSYAIDFQVIRDVATEVASGSYSYTMGISNMASGSYGVCLGGYKNTSSGQYSITGGWSNVASGQNSTAIGESGRAYLQNQFANGLYRFTSAGDGQTSNVRVGRLITGTSTSELFTNTSNNTGRLNLPTFLTNGFWNARIQVIAVRKTVGNGSGNVGDTYTAEYSVGIKKIGSTTSLVGSVNTLWTNADAGINTASFTISADDTNDSLKIEYTPSANAGSTTVTQVVATVYLTETSF